MDFLSYLVEDQEVLKSKKDYSKRLKKSKIKYSQVSGELRFRESAISE